MRADTLGSSASTLFPVPQGQALPTCLWPLEPTLPPRGSSAEFPTALEAFAFLVSIFSKWDPHRNIFSRHLIIVITLMGGEQGKLAKR